VLLIECPWCGPRAETEFSYGGEAGIERQIRGYVRCARLARAAAAMEALSPLSTLARGYAVPLDPDGRLLRGIRDFGPGRDFDLRVADGYVPATVAGRPRSAAAPYGSRPAEAEDAG